ncbi:excinuclease Cho [Duffyella gerundensis]|uniref:Excinuclease cho n=1 Tax=Duffyella gerundensis TaxID=1619313 RepID=A0A0U5GL66_9GAMM|nr:excinuclease Cho [Duffyella gerundensis]QTO52728.1 excinuclease Cho [Duffyella gerundensis]UCB31215.1 excinuclease Cho [Duffyella gerundensis]CUU23876.1 Excinuclease cho [Duffyella gerundensis]
MVRRASTHRLEFNAATIYEYPEHLRQWLDGLPKVPGVYTFHGESDTLPLYIGKSINLRSRVMSHFRTQDEAKMLRLARRVSWITTAGELGALLLEAQMIKTQQPLFNKRLRKNRQLCSLQLNDDKPQVVYAKEVDFTHSPNLYGLYANRRAALETLKKIADEQQLCYGLLGLESLTKNRGCFRSALGRCAGACCGKETLEAHHQRLLTALDKVRVVCWPWQGPVGLIEEGPDITQIHVIDNWFYLGSVSNLDEAKTLKRAPPGFDQDGYKILCRPVIGGKYQIVPL